MSRGNRRPKMNGSMAGWLFADLSIVLAIVFMTSLQATNQDASSTTTTTSTTTSTTTTTLPSTPDTKAALACNGVVPRPVEVRISNTRAISDRQIFQQINTLLDKNYPDSNFSMVIIYSGTGGDRSEQASSSAVKSSQDIGETLRSFDRFVNEQYVESNWNPSIRLNEAKIKIFPNVCD